MSVSESSSTNPFPQYRVRRKPPPAIDVAEKYPSPDPHDPFAPLWVLRNRTSSALGQNPLVTKDTPSPYSETPIRTHQGSLMGKMDTFKSNSASHSIPIERRRSNSTYLFPHSTTNTHATPPRSSSTVPQKSNHAARMVHTFNRRPSQSGATTTGGGVSHPPMKPAQVISDSTLRSNAMSRTDKKRNDPHPQPRAPGNIPPRLTVDMRTSDNSSGNETESDLSVPAPERRPQWVDVKVKAIDVESQGKTNNAGLTTTISFNVGVDVKPALLRRIASNGTTSTGSASLARNVSPQPMSQQSRLAKFLLPKKTSHDGYMADGEKRNIKPNSTANQKGPVHKLSISAPLTDTFVHEGRSQSQQSKDTTSSARKPSRSRAGYTSDTDLEEGTGGIRLRGVLFRARKKASTDDTHVSATSNPTPPSADPVIPMPAVEVVKSEHPDDKETERRRPEMSWAEVNIEEYYTPITSPRGSYPTPAPSPQLKPALELEQEAPSEGVGGKLSKGRKVEEKKTNSESANKGFTTEVKGQLETVDVSEATLIDPVTAPAPRVRKLKATKTPGSTVLTTSALRATTTAVPFPSPSVSVPPSSFVITPLPPPPPPKLSKRRTSSTTPAQAIVEGTSATPSDPAQVQSISTTSNVHVSLISVPKPSEPLLNENLDAGAFVKPRRAPRPPAIVEGVQSEPEPLKRERFDDLWKGDKKQSREDKQDGREVVSRKIKVKSDDEAQVQKRQHIDVAVKEMKVPEMDAKASSRHPISGLKHGRAASTSPGSRKDKPAPGVGRTEDSDDGVSKKATVPVSMSTPAYLSSKEKEGGCLPRARPQGSRPNFHPRGVSPDNSFNSFGFPPTEYGLPTRTQLSRAASLPVYAEDGRKHLFGSLFEKQKTVVIFIRHFWCPLCQDYMSVVKSTVTSDMIVAGGWTKAGAERDEDEVVWKRGVAEVEKIDFVVISNGAHGMIAKYRQIFSLPFRVYTDPSLAIYKLLGMGKTGTDCQDPQHGHPTNYLSDSPAPPMPKKKKHNYSLRKKADTSVSSLSDREREQGGGYVKHGLMSGIAMVVVRAFKVGMPVWEKGGDVGQLGGEFVFGPGLICTYAHKMQSSKGHAPIEEVLQAAGVKLKSPELPPRPSSPQALDPQLPATPKQDLAQKQTNSVDLSSPPKPSKETPRQPIRNRKESLKGTPETISSNRASAIIANATTIKSISYAQPRGSSQRERQGDQSPSPIPTLGTSHKIIPPALPPALRAVMTREEETRWAEERQKSMERVIQDRGNNVRRLGALGRSPSSQGQGGASARPSQGNGGGYVVQPATTKEGRGNALMTESRSAPLRSSEEEERIVYKAEGRRVQERTRGFDVHGSGTGYVQRVSTTRVGPSQAATTSSRR